MNFLASFVKSALNLSGILSINFDPKGFVDMLKYMGMGMFVIFVLIGVIIMVTILINEIFSGRKYK